jgi:hypothetical protein
MTRFSADTWPNGSSPRNQRSTTAKSDSIFSIHDDDDDELNYSMSDDENEPPHPLGFSQYCVEDEPDESLEACKVRVGFQYPYAVTDAADSFFCNDNENNYEQRIPPITSYLSANDTPTKSLIAFSYNQASLLKKNQYHEDNAENQFSFPLMIDATTTTIADRNNNQSAATRMAARIVRPYQLMQADISIVRQEMEAERQRFEREHAHVAQGLQRLRDDEAAARDIATRNEEELRQKEQADRERVKNDQLRREQAAAGAAAQEQQDKAAREIKKQAQEAVAAAAAIVTSQQAAAAAAVVSNPSDDHVARAEKLITQLDKLRASVAAFDSSKDARVRARRLQFKKLVGGTINTLAENEKTIERVATAVSQTILTARDDDEQIRQALSANTPNVTPEMARGKRYLLDLICSKIIVRVQADGFNGYVVVACIAYYVFLVFMFLTIYYYLHLPHKSTR